MCPSYGRHPVTKNIMAILRSVLGFSVRGSKIDRSLGAKVSPFEGIFGSESSSPITFVSWIVGKSVVWKNNVLYVGIFQVHCRMLFFIDANFFLLIMPISKSSLKKALFFFQ